LFRSADPGIDRTRSKDCKSYVLVWTEYLVPFGNNASLVLLHSIIASSLAGLKTRRQYI
jgi:hypothetical protein